MAGIETRNGRHRLKFRHGGRQRSINLGAITIAEAEAKATQVDALLALLDRGLLRIPDGVTVETFLFHDGKPPDPSGPEREDPTLAAFRDRYLQVHRDSLEPRTVEGVELHFRHMVANWGGGFRIRSLGLADLQAYVDARSKAKHRGSRISPATIRKELISLRTAWNWGAKMGLVDGRFPSDGLRFPKGREKPPFMTRAEIERHLGADGLTKKQQAEAWEALYLLSGEIAEVLEAIRERANHAWIYPAACTAAHAGARWSELARMRLGDVDFDGGTLLVREKKRVRGRDSTRRVPLTPFLAGVLKDRIASGPPGPFLFCHEPIVDRSKTRGRNTRGKPGAPLTVDEGHDHLERTLKATRWSVIRGWHVFRHSFVSACASRGVDQRMLQEWAGHQTAEMQRRYAHLYPNVQRDVIRSVFEI